MTCPLVEMDEIDALANLISVLEFLSSTTRYDGLTDLNLALILDPFVLVIPKYLPFIVNNVSSSFFMFIGIYTTAINAHSQEI